MRTAIAIAVLAVLPALRAQFNQQEITKQDIIDLYAVPVRESPAFKYEWKVACPTIFRLSLEFKRSGEQEWRVQNSMDRTVDQSVWLMFLRADPRKSRTGDGRYFVDVHFGFETSVFHGWSSFAAIMSDVGEFPVLTAGGIDPDNLLIVEAKTGTYRLRLEKLPTQT